MPKDHLGADLQQVLGLPDPELLEEHVRHRPVVVLAGVDHDVRIGPEPVARGRDHRGHLHEVGAGADDV